MKIIKKITKIGTGHHILIDKVILASLKAKEGDFVDISSIEKVTIEKGAKK